MDEVSVSGAPAIVTALGMGTVFLCLALLYVITRLLGRWLPRWLGSAERAAPVEGVESEDQAAALPAARQESPVGDEPIVAAMTLALARHRFSRVRSIEERRGDDPWKIAGRIRMLRVR